jgi:hypothetical protein
MLLSCAILFTAIGELNEVGLSVMQISVIVILGAFLMK